MKTSKILSSNFSTPWGTGANLTYFFTVQLEGEPRAYTIGVKQQTTPAWLQPGQMLDWEFKDEAKGSIKKFKQPFGQPAAPGTHNGWSAPNVDTTDLKISTGLICATILYSAGRAEKEQINDIAANVVRKFDEIKASL